MSTKAAVDILRAARELLPTMCLVCRRSLHRGYSLCPECEAELPWIERNCGRCGEELDQSAVEICPRCRIEAPIFDTCFAPFSYRPPVDKLIVDYKFHGNFAGGYALSRILARELTRRWRRGDRPDLLLPVPLHDSRLRHRGFNQALEIAKVVAAASGAPLLSNTLKKCRSTPPQTEMRGLRERGGNIRASFELARPADLGQARKVALLDDVVTTMSTVSELTALLKTAGVAEVEVCCLARAGL